MTTGKTATAVETTLELLRAADTDIVRFFGFFSDDCDFRMANNEVVHGRQDIQNWVAAYLGAVAGMRHEAVEIWAEGDTVAVRVDVTYTMKNGQEFTLPAVTRTRVRDGQVVEYLIFMDPSPVTAAGDRP